MVCPLRGHTIPRVSAIEMPTTDLGLLYSDQLPFKLPTLIPYVKPRTLMITQPDTVDAPSQGMHCKGIYIVANDRVQEQAIALLNSIRRVDAEVTVILIPFDDHYQGVFGHLHHHHGVQLFPDLDLITAWTDKIGTIFPKDFLNLPNKLRKIVTWLGPLDQFLYIDADIIVFDRIAAALDYLDDYDFICCDYHHRGRGIQDVFAPLVVDQHLFTAADLQDVFNSGFWGSRKDALSPATLEAILRDCAAHREYFDFSQKTTDQPLLNYLVLKTMARRFNLVRLPDWSTGSWAGSPQFQRREWQLYDGDRPLRYLHWAGTPLQPGGAYWDLWFAYRYWNQDPPVLPPAPPPQSQGLKAAIDRARSLWHRIKAGLGGL